MSLGKKVTLLLLSLVGLIIFTVSSYDYKTILGESAEVKESVSNSSFFSEYTDPIISKIYEIKDDISIKLGLPSNEKVVTLNKLIDLELIKQDGNVMMSGTFKNEQQAKEVADLLNINRNGEFIFEENRVKDVMQLNKIASIIISFKDFFSDGAKLSVEDGKVLLNGELKDANYKDLLDSILERSNLDVISNVKEPSLSKTEEIIASLKVNAFTETIEVANASTDEKINNNEINENIEIKEDLKVAKEKENDDISNVAQNSKEVQSIINSILSKKKIIFKRRSTTITKDSYISIKEIASVLKENGHIKFEIAGHTDSRGRASLNKRISQDRANSVRVALIALGIEKDRLKAVGYGEEFPIVKDDVDGLSELNRRVEFNIMGEK